MTIAPHPAVYRSIAVSVALAAGLALAGCQKTPEGAIDRKEVDHALEVLAAAPIHGFAPGAFNEARIRQLSESDKPGDLKVRDQLLRASLVAYARAQHGLSIPKSKFPQVWGLRPAEYDAEAELAKAVADGTFGEWLDSQAPEAPTYQGMQRIYVTYLNVSAKGGWPEIAKGPTLKAGATGPRVQALRQRLAFEDPEVGKIALDAPFDAALAEGVKRYQAANGITPTGVVDPVTLKELNIPVITRAAQIRANLERLRWLPREEPATRVDVNTAAATFTYYRDGQPAMTMLSASGKPGDETPMLASKIDSIVLNPPWNVPDGIAQEELYPKGEAYLAANNFTTVEGRLVQQPGPDSALGLVKFDFKNPYAVYLHDTPAKAAFERDRRAVSHGCVRLQHAVAFAKTLLAENGWSASKVDQALAAGETMHVKLDKAVPVRLLYLTAFPDAGRIAFRQDVYGWDGDLLRLLDANAGRTTVAMAKAAKRG